MLRVGTGVGIRCSNAAAPQTAVPRNAYRPYNPKPASRIIHMGRTGPLDYVNEA